MPLPEHVCKPITCAQVPHSWPRVIGFGVQRGCGGPSSPRPVRPVHPGTHLAEVRPYQGACQLEVAKLSSVSLMCCILVCFVLCGACCLLARCSYAACASHVSVWCVCGRRCVGLLGRSESSVTLGLQLLTAAVTRGGSALALPGAAPLLHILQHVVAMHVVWLGTGCVPVLRCTRRLQSIYAAKEKTGLG